MDQATATAFDGKQRVQYRIKRFSQRGLSKLFDTSLHVCGPWLNVMFKRSHQKLSRQLIDATTHRAGALALSYSRASLLLLSLALFHDGVGVLRREDSRVH